MAEAPLQRINFAILTASFIAATMLFVETLRLKSSDYVNLRNYTQSIQTDLNSFEHEIIALKSNNTADPEHLTHRLTKHQALIIAILDALENKSYIGRAEILSSFAEYQDQFALYEPRLMTFTQSVIALRNAEADFLINPAFCMILSTVQGIQRQVDRLSIWFTPLAKSEFARQMKFPD